MTRVIIILIIESYLLFRSSTATSECNGSKQNFSSYNINMGGAS